MVLYEAASKAKNKSRTSFVKRKPVRNALPDRTVKPMPAKSYRSRNDRRLKLYMAIAATVVIVVLGLYGISKLSNGDQVMVAGPLNNDTQNTQDIDTAGRTVADSDNEIDGSASTRESATQPSLDKTQEIVVASHAFSNELVQVKKYFELNGIETDIIKSGSGYMLVTVEKFVSPAKPEGKAGIDAAKTKIKEIGKYYKPPKGYGSFKFDKIYVSRIQVKLQ